MGKLSLDIDKPLPLGRFKGKTLRQLVSDREFYYLNWMYFTVVVNSYPYYKLTKRSIDFIEPYVVDFCKENKKFLDLDTILMKGKYQGYNVEDVVMQHPDYIEYLYFDCNYFVTAKVLEKIRESKRIKSQFQLMH